MAAAGGAFGGSRGLQALPPQKGVFPLDHFGECKEIMTEYMRCLKKNKNQSEKCRQISKTYLQCRMERNLMAKQDLRSLGFVEEDIREGGPTQGFSGDSNGDGDGDRASTPPGDGSAPTAEQQQRRKKESGFLAGLPKRPH